MRYDKYKTWYEKTALFLGRHGRLKGTVLTLDKYLPLCFYAAYPVLAVVSALQLQTDFWLYFLSAGLPFFAFVFVSVLRKIVKRPRPYEPSGANITPLHDRTEKLGESFPSRHAASAFVISIILTRLWLPLGLGLLGAAITIIFTRMVSGHHYPTDLIVGSLLGTAFGLPIFFV